jgi:hypothetical protein
MSFHTLVYFFSCIADHKVWDVCLSMWFGLFSIARQFLDNSSDQGGSISAYGAALFSSSLDNIDFFLRHISLIAVRTYE